MDYVVSDSSGNIVFILNVEKNMAVIKDGYSFFSTERLLIQDTGNGLKPVDATLRLVD